MNKRKESSLVLWSILFILIPLLFPQAAKAWKPYTHNYTGEEVVSGIDFANGTMSINGKTYRIRPEIITAIKTWPAFYYAGTVGPDGFPDLTYGQAVIHPEDTGRWLSLLLEKAWEAQNPDSSYSSDEKGQILAFTYGFFMHAAGDVWGHTIVNEFAGGVFPPVFKALTNVDLAAIALKHIISEGYIGDATPSWDGDNSEEHFVPAPSNYCRPPMNCTQEYNDTSDDTTPGYPYDVPHRFIYNVLIDPASQTPVPTVLKDGTPNYMNARGPLIGFFLETSDALQASVDTDRVEPLADAIKAYDDTLAALAAIESDCNFEDLAACPVCPDTGHDLFWCPADILLLGFDVTIDSAEAFWAFVSDTSYDLALIVFNSYLEAWIDDINDGLVHWSELGLATTRALFDAQTRRDLQNEDTECGLKTTPLELRQCKQGVGLLHVVSENSADFINDYLLGMVGGPAGDVAGDLRTILDELGDTFETIIGYIELPFNPVQELATDIKEKIKDDIIYPAISDAIGIDVEMLGEFLKKPSRYLCLSSVSLTSPELGTVSIPLFDNNEETRLDDYLGFSTADHLDPGLGLPAGCGRLADTSEYDPNIFPPIKDTITMGKLLLLDGTELNKVLSNILGDREIGTYKAGQNIMTATIDNSEEWLRLIDGDHAWRSDGAPKFGPRDPIITGGTGAFPLWKSCVLRPAFKVLFADWENGALNFPDLNDLVGADDVNDPFPPTSSLSLNGTSFEDGSAIFVAANNSFTLTAHDTPEKRSFKDSELGLQRRTYTTPSAPGAWQNSTQGEKFSLSGPDRTYYIDVRSSDPCHTFENTPSQPEAKRTFAYVLDATPPVTTCNTPPFGMVFATDATSKVSYSISDGSNGSGVASSSSTIDGLLSASGVVSIANNAVLDMYNYNPGTRTVTVAATDNLENSGNTACTFQIHATAASLINNLKRAQAEGLVTDPLVYQGLMDKLVAADKAKRRGQVGADINILQAFISQLLAQRGKGIDFAKANQFIAYAQDLIAIGG